MSEDAESVMRDKLGEFLDDVDAAYGVLEALAGGVEVVARESGGFSLDARFEDVDALVVAAGLPVEHAKSIAGLAGELAIMKRIDERLRMVSGDDA